MALDAGIDVRLTSVEGNQGDTSGLSGCEILSAELNLWFFSWTKLTGNPDQDRTFGLYLVEDASWEEETLAYRNSPNMADDPTDVTTMLIGYGAEFGWKTWDVTDAWPSSPGGVCPCRRHQEHRGQNGRSCFAKHIKLLCWCQCSPAHSG